MEASIRNIRRVRSADLAITAGITLVAGENDNGKSSTLGAIAAAITGASLLPDVLKKDAAQLVHDGAEQGSVQISTGEGHVRLALPAAEIGSTGKPPHASVFAAGIDSLVDIDQTKRASTLIDYLKATPSRDQIFQALRDIGLDEHPRARQMRDEGEKYSVIAETLRCSVPAIPMDEFGLVLTEITQGGWDEAHGRRVEANRRARGGWEQITKAKYGAVKAASWLPTGWLPALDKVTIEQAETHLDEARTRHAGALKAVGASDADRAAKEADASLYAARVKLHDAAVEAATKAETSVVAAQAALSALPVPATDDALSCPHCQGRVRVGSNMHGQILEKADTALPQSEIKKRRDDRAAAAGDLSRLQTEAGTASRALEQVKSNLRSSVAARDWLTAHPEGDGGAAVDIDGPAEDLKKAEIAVAMLRQKAEAAGKHQEIQRNEALIAVLDPKGLRRQALDEHIGAFNRLKLAPIAEAANWKPVEITIGDTIDFSYGGRPYKHLGQSAQYRVRVSLQVAMAQIDGSDLLIVDGADVLTPKAKDGRGGLFALLLAQAVPALVGMTLWPHDPLPDLARAGYGRTYLVVDGVVQPLAEQVAA